MHPRDIISQHLVFKRNKRAANQRPRGHGHACVQIPALYWEPRSAWAGMCRWHNVQSKISETDIKCIYKSKYLSVLQRPDHYFYGFDFKWSKGCLDLVLWPFWRIMRHCDITKLRDPCHIPPTRQGHPQLCQANDPKNENIDIFYWEWAFQ